MFVISFEVFVTAFLVTGLVFFVTVWMYYDRRDKRYYDQQRLRNIHHCVKCGTLYVSRKGGEPADCPKCGFQNNSLRF